ncbi:MAG: polysaccharide biosynthesis/export family protein [Planctomycetaceae bacterium]
MKPSNSIPSTTAHFRSLVRQNADLGTPRSGERGYSVLCRTGTTLLNRLARAVVCGALTGVLGLSGCAAFRPIDGIPARYVPDEVKAPKRSGKKTIDLSLLSQTQPSVYHLDTGDVLAISIEGVMPRREGELPPVNLSFNTTDESLPALGYPVPIRADGTISLPLLHNAISVRGMTVKQAEDAVRRAYTVDKKILLSGNERVWVILHRPRQYRVLVIRQEGVEAPASGGQPGSVNLGALKRGTGRAVTLAAYKNDVLHALAETGGLPGLDAENTIYVLRSKRRPAEATTDSFATGAPPHSGWSTAPSQFGVPPLPEAGHSLNPSPNGYGPGFPNAPGANPPAVLPILPQEPISPSDSQNANPDPQTRSSRYSGIVPASFHTDSAGHSSDMVPPTNFSPGMYGAQQSLPMNSSARDWQAGLPPLQASSNWQEISAENWMGHASMGDPTLANQGVTKIPVRLAPGEQTRFTERDILLEDGDIVFIESRDTEIFYTGGLLGGGQYTLPRDYDLDVLGAVAIAQAGRGGSNATRATGGITALNNDVTISASQAVILRKMPNGSQVPIKVDLYRALRHPDERVLMQPGDFLLLQYTPLEAIGAFFERHLLEGALFGVAAAQLQSNR